MGPADEPREALSAAEQRFERWRRKWSLFCGPLFFAIVLLWPMPGLTPAAHKLCAVLIWVLVYWVGEGIPLPATALLGPTLCVVLGIASPQIVFAPFASPIIFLFIGSFLLAESMIAHRLNERISLGLLSVRWLQRSPARLAVAVGLVPFLMSMWISDSATTAMFYPILLGVLATITGAASADRFGEGLLLTISYAALIGGVATPVGTPPNLIGIAMLEKLGGVRILFLQWMTVGVPLATLMVVGMFLTMRFSFRAPRIDPYQIQAHIARRREALGPWTRGQVNTLLAFLLAIILWVTPGLWASIAGTASPTCKLLEAHLPEGVASLIAALLLFVLPTDFRRREFTISWAHAMRIDWGTIMLFGGGLSLGGLMFSTGLAERLGQSLVQASGVGSVWGLVAVATAMAIVLTEMTSNTATASTLTPTVIALARTMAVSPVPPVLGVCFGASMAFMLPVSTPSNAIVYGSGRVSILSMIRSGIVLDLLSYAIILVGLRVLCPLLGLV